MNEGIVACLCSLLFVVLAAPVSAQTAAGEPTPSPTPKSRLLFIDNERVKIEGRAEVALGAFAYRGAFFNLTELSTPGYDSRRRFGEAWFEPGVDLTLRTGKNVELYSGLSIGASGTWGTDVFDARNEISIQLENAFVGVRTTNPENSWNVDFSFGQQNYTVGTGMLIALGADNGLNLGAVNLQPRSAWSKAAVGRFSYRGFHAEGFYLDPHSLEEFDTIERLAGGVTEYRWKDSRVGVAYVKVLQSNFEYPLPVPPLVIEKGREGLHSIDTFVEIDGTVFGVKNAWARGEFVLQRKASINMRSHAYHVGSGYRFVDARWSPSVSVEHASFSADDPDSARYERFDPLFYGAGSVDWFFGANSSSAFLNSNVNQWRAVVSLALTDKNSLELQYIHSRANKLNSPIQFNELDREEVIDGVPTFLTGVTHPHLADELYAAWTREFTPNRSITVWGSLAVPGRAFKSFPGANPQNWSGAGFLFSLTF